MLKKIRINLPFVHGSTWLCSRLSSELVADGRPLSFYRWSMGCMRTCKGAMLSQIWTVTLTLLLWNSSHGAVLGESECPQTEAGQRVAELAGVSRQDGETPYLFRKQQVQVCPGGDPKSCPAPLKWYWQNFCSFERNIGGGWAAYMICDDARQQNIVKYLRGKGVAGFEGILNLSPCDLWPLIRCAARTPGTSRTEPLLWDLKLRIAGDG